MVNSSSFEGIKLPVLQLYIQIVFSKGWVSTGSSPCFDLTGSGSGFTTLIIGPKSTTGTGVTRPDIIITSKITRSLLGGSCSKPWSTLKSTDHQYSRLEKPDGIRRKIMRLSWWVWMDFLKYFLSTVLWRCWKWSEMCPKICCVPSVCDLKDAYCPLNDEIDHVGWPLSGPRHPIYQSIWSRKSFFSSWFSIPKCYRTVKKRHTTLLPIVRYRQVSWRHTIYF